MSRSKIVALIPFFGLLVPILYCWHELWANDYIPFFKHIAAIVLILINAIVYLLSFKKGIWMTGLVLLLASFSLIAITTEITESSFFIKMGSLKISFPTINYLSLFLVVLYCVINRREVKEGMLKIKQWFE